MSDSKENYSAKTKNSNMAVTLYFYLYGVIILLSLTYTIGVQWHRYFTIGNYLVSIVLCAYFVLIRFSKRDTSLSVFDIAFAVFILAIICSWIFTSDFKDSGKIYGLLYFLVPAYLFGRFFKKCDVSKLLTTTLWGGG